MNLPKETKDFCAENYKTLMKEIKGDTNKWRDTSTKTEIQTKGTR